jgi:hypothetical protein
MSQYFPVPERAHQPMSQAFEKIKLSTHKIISRRTESELKFKGRRLVGRSKA